MMLVVILILIVDDSAIFREGLRAMLEAHTDWEVCGEAMNGVEGVQKNRLLKPHLIIMDLSMPQMSGIEAAAEILKEFPKVPILLLTLYLTPNSPRKPAKSELERRCRKQPRIILSAASMLYCMTKNLSSRIDAPRGPDWESFRHSGPGFPLCVA